MITKNFNIYVDFNNKVTYAPTRFTAGDSGSCTMTFKTVQDITGLRVFVNFLMSDATTYILEATVSDANTATLTLPSGVLSVVGEVSCQVALYGTTERLTQPLSFGYTVVADLSDGAIEASDNYPILLELIDEVESGEAQRNADYAIAEADRDTDYSLAEGVRDDAYDAAEVVRDGLYSNRETYRDGLYSTAETARDGLYTTAEGARDSLYDGAESGRGDEYDLAETARDGLYSTAEGARDTAYGLAEIARDDEYDLAEIARDGEYDVAEAARDVLYEAREDLRDTIVGGLDARVKVTELQCANQQLELNDIERTLSLMNPNQSTRVDITSAAQTVALPKTAGIGPVKPTLRGLTATNMVNGANIAVGNTVTFASVLNSKYYDSLHGTVLTGDGNNMTVTNDTAATANIMVINLTATFPSAEPNATTCALLFPTYFDGTQSVIAPRLRSVGKNLFDGKIEIGTLITATGLPSATTVGYRTDFIRVTSGSYIRNTPSGQSVSGTFVYDSNKKFHSYLGTDSSITIPTGAHFIRFRARRNDSGTVLQSDLDTFKTTFQLEAGTVATTYEPYTDLSALYTEPLTLRSNATHQDTITPTDGRMIYQQRIDPSTYATLDPLPAAVEVATSGILQSYPSGTIYAEHALADAGLYTTSIGVLNTDFPIQTLESLYIVDPVTGVKTALDHTTATIAGDGLSFTHAGLTSGDIVFFTYHYAFSGVWGQNVYSHFDGSIVQADTADGKFYKLGWTVTNGVVTMTATEVT